VQGTTPADTSAVKIVTRKTIGAVEPKVHHKKKAAEAAK